MNIDWCKAPEGTTHANPEDPMGSWRKVVEGVSHHWDGTTWLKLHPRAYESAKSAYVKKP